MTAPVTDLRKPVSVVKKWDSWYVNIDGDIHTLFPASTRKRAYEKAANYVAANASRYTLIRK